MSSSWHMQWSAAIHSLADMMRALWAKFSPGGGGYFSISFHGIAPMLHQV